MGPSRRRRARDRRPHAIWGASGGVGQRRGELRMERRLCGMSAVAGRGVHGWVLLFDGGSDCKFT